MTSQRPPSYWYPAWPRTFLGLLLLGYGAVALPLVAALVYVTGHIERLTHQSQNTVHRAIQATQHSRLMLEQLTALERIVRQYQVLQDPALLEAYAQKHLDLELSLQQLERLMMDPAIRMRVLELRRREADIATLIRNSPGGSLEGGFTTFEQLHSLAQPIPEQIRWAIEAESESLRAATSEARQILTWVAVGFIPTTLLFAGVFTILLSRPIKQLDHAIRSLGDGEFGGSIAVSGPRDLRFLGGRLDWLRDRLRELGEQKTQFIRRVSHELKTPLTALREGADLLADGVIGPLNPDQLEVATILRQNSVKLQKLIEDLLNFNLAASAPHQRATAPVDLAHLVKHVASDHKLTMVTKDIQLRTELPELIIEGDEGQLRVVVDNLLSNAIKFTPQNGIIRVTLSSLGNQALLDVEDTGPGLSSAEAEHIFEAFYRGSAPASGYIKGSGLGLSIAKEYVLAHDGQIEVLPETGRGAHFRVTLPHKQVRRAHAA